MVRTLQESGFKGRKKVGFFTSLLLFFILNFSAFGQATLPTSHDGLWQSISKTGWSQSGLGEDFLEDLGNSTNGASANFDGSGDALLIAFSSAPATLSFYINPLNETLSNFGGNFVVEESDGVGAYTTLRTFTPGSPTTALVYQEGGTQISLSPLSTTRSIRFRYVAQDPNTLDYIQLDDVSLTAAPTGAEIGVKQGATTLLSNDPTPYSFGSQNVNTTGSTITFTIENTGPSTLNINSISLSGTNDDQFTLNQFGTSSTVAGPSGSTTFSIAFSPTSFGTKTAVLTINNNDADESAYVINLSGSAVILAPTISSISPTQGPVGTTVIIAGTNLVNTSSVKFNNTTASFKVDSDTQITTTVPSGATSGDVTVSYSGGTITGPSFTVETTPAPSNITFSPTAGKIGTSVTISGNNFNGATSVRFNGTSAVITSVSSTQIVTTVPTGATTGTVSVTNPGGTGSSTGTFTVYQAPVISSISPSSGPIGTVVTITGNNFTQPSSLSPNISVKVNGKSAVKSSFNNTQIVITIPSGATTGTITVDTRGGTATSSTFTVTVPVPVISNISPASGMVGSLVTIVGSDFTNVSSVAFNSTNATNYSVDNSGQITVEVPTGATTGPITVTTPGGTATSTTYTVTVPTRTYTWNVNTGNWSDANSWTPVRNTPSTADTLIFNGLITSGPTATLDFASSQTIGRLKFINGVNATLTTTSDKTLNIDNGIAGADLVVQAGTIVTLNNSVSDADITLNLTSGETGTVAGTIQVQGAGTAAHRITATDTNSLTFQSGSNFVTGTNFSGEPFGSTNFNSVMFAAGSTYRNTAGGSPFGATIPNAVVTFNTASNYIHEASTAPDLDGRTYGNFDINSTANQNVAGGNLIVSNLTLTGAASTTFNINLTGVININGNVNVNSGTLGFEPASGNSIYLNGASTVVAGSGGLTLGTNANLIIPTGVTVDLYKDITGTGEVIVYGTVRTSDGAGFSGGASTSFTTNIITTLQPGSTVEYNGTGSQNISLDDYANLAISGSRSGGTITFPNTTLTVSENLTTPATNATYNFGTGTVEFNGTAQSIPALSFNNVTISGSNTKSIAGNINVAGTLAITGGILETGANKVILGSGANLQESETSYIVGGIETTRTISTNGVAENFGSIGASMTSTGSVVPGSTTIYRITGEVVQGNPTNSISRQYFISAANNGDPGLQVTLTLGYWDHELAGQDVNNLVMYKRQPTTSNWDAQGTVASYARATNAITLPGVTGFSLWTIGEDPTVLPVSLVYFTAKRNGELAELSWKTASEKDNKGFEVQVSEDAKHFRVLGFVASQNSNSHSPLTYSFLDQEAGKQGIRYYRIRQVDLDGTESYYATKAVKFDVSQVTVKAYPNPFEAEFEAQVDAEGSDKIYLTVTNSIGENVYEKSVNARAGLNRIPVQLNQNLPAGVYILNIITNNKQQRLKLIKK